MGDFVDIRSLFTVIFMPYLVNNSKTKINIEKMRKPVFVGFLESVDQENKRNGEI